MKKFWDTWPKYLRVTDKYGTQIYFLPDKATLIELMVHVASYWHNQLNIFGEEDWYETDYTTLFNKHVGLSEDEFEALKDYITPTNELAFKTILDSVKSIDIIIKNNKLRLAHVQFINKLENGEVDMKKASNINALYDILTYYTYDHKPMFEVNNFDKAN